MARPIRLEFPNALYHIMSRGNGGENIFIEDADKLAFVELFEELLTRYDVICYAYCLMDTQWSASHGHLAFFGAYATINIAFFYLAIQHWRGDVWMTGGIKHTWRWKWALGLLNAGVLGMTIALLIAGYEQSFIERAIEGSTWGGYFSALNHPSFQNAMNWRLFWGVVTAAGFGLLVWDLLTIGKGETRKAEVITES